MKTCSKCHQEWYAGVESECIRRGACGFSTNNTSGADQSLASAHGSFSSDEIQMILSGLSRLADAAGDYGDGYTRRAANALGDKIKKILDPVH